MVLSTKQVDDEVLDVLAEQLMKKAADKFEELTKRSSTCW